MEFHNWHLYILCYLKEKKMACSTCGGKGYIMQGCLTCRGSGYVSCSDCLIPNSGNQRRQEVIEDIANSAVDSNRR
ncbi:unnamed protein product [Rhizophagus irregularis]|nr:unnamed protein product [Rhizophagus irregularis]